MPSWRGAMSLAIRFITDAGRGRMRQRRDVDDLADAALDLKCGIQTPFCAA